MAYVGTPIDTQNQFQSLQGKRFNGDASTTAFTLDIAPNSVFDIEVFVENVRQDPNSAYTLNGTTLTFSAAPPSGTNNIYVIHQAKAVGTITAPVGGSIDMNGVELILDEDGDTSITADTDDQIDFKVGGSDVMTLGPSNLTIDISGNIRLDADDSGEIRLLDGGTQYGAIKADSQRVKIQGIVSDKDMFLVVNDGGSEVTAIQIEAADGGNVLIGGSNADYVSGGGIQTNGSSGDKLYGMRHTGTTSGTHVADWNTGVAGGGLSSTGNFLRLTDGGNLRFQFKGDGNATCDGSFSGGGADYAEYFEWTDGNSSNEDRIGLSVVLDNGKIREATASDTNIIGVVSANPTVIGDEQPHHWQNKFVTDDFGRVQYETLTCWKWEIDGTTDGYIEGRTDKDIPENATNVESFQHSYERINPNYDETVEYTPRSQRQEWDCIGLMGKLRIKKGQQTSSNWIKIRDISDTVEEWLVK